MAVNPLFRGVRSYNKGRAYRLPISATAVQYGDLLKMSSGNLVAVADNEEDVEVYVALESCTTGATDLLVVPFSDAVVELEESGTTTVGESYGVTGPRVVDATNTTQKLVTVLKRNTDRGTVEVKQFAATF